MVLWLKVITVFSNITNLEKLESHNIGEHKFLLGGKAWKGDFVINFATVVHTYIKFILDVF